MKKQTNELPSFHYGFQLSRTIVFEVNYKRLGNNKNKHFATSAAQFNQPKTDYNLCGQAQEELLKGFNTAMSFYKKWDKKHLKDLAEAEYNDLKIDIEKLKETYNYVIREGDNYIQFSTLKELPMQPIKKQVKAI